MKHKTDNLTNGGKTLKSFVLKKVEKKNFFTILNREG